MSNEWGDSEDTFPTSGHPQPRESGGGCLGLVGMFVLLAAAGLGVLLVGAQIGMAVVA